MKIFSALFLIGFFCAVLVTVQSDGHVRGQIIEAIKTLKAKSLVPSADDQTLIDDFSKIIDMIEANIGLAPPSLEAKVQVFVKELKGKLTDMQSTGKFDSSIFEMFKEFGKSMKAAIIKTV
jgi:isopentenyl diphosphate isomerase/L-lactate dehydrogenase-like FMN-dependent dehydrogenase